MLDVYPSYDAFKALRRHKTDRRPRRRREEEGGEGELAISLKDNWRLPFTFLSGRSHCANTRPAEEEDDDDEEEEDL